MQRRPGRALSLWLVSCIGALCAARSAQAAEFYIDPVGGSAGGDGSKAKPWATLADVAKGGAFGTTIKAGDTVWLLSGYHGAPVLKGGDFTPPVVIAAAAGEKPTASNVVFQGAKGLTLRGLSISPSHAPMPAVVTMVTIDAASERVTLEDSHLFSVPDTSAWTADQWVNAASSGISTKGTDVVLRGNQLTDVRFGISVEGPGTLVDRNSIVRFSADGMRGLGDNDVFQYNLVKDVYVDDAAGDSNHDDGFQSWSVGPNGVGTGVVKGLVLRGNVILNREDPNQPFPNALQGIGCFDGFFEGWVVENNVIMTDHWHGISFYGVRSSRIVNNTVIDINDVSPGPPWIKVAPHKDGTASQDVIVRNNLATDYQLEGMNVTDDHNTKLADLSMFFVAPAKFDVHLLPGAPAVDTGSADMAPALDAEGIPRPQGKGFDLGAYEWHDPSVMGTGGAAGGAAGAGGSGAGGTGGGAGGSAGAGTGGSGGNAAGGASTGGSAGSGGSGSTGKPGGCGCAIEERVDPPTWPLLVLAIGLLRRMPLRRVSSPRGPFARASSSRRASRARLPRS